MAPCQVFTRSWSYNLNFKRDPFPLPREQLCLLSYIENTSFLTPYEERRDVE